MHRKIKQIGVLFLAALIISVSTVTVTRADPPGEEQGGEEEPEVPEEPEAPEESEVPEEPEEPEEPEVPGVPEEPETPKETEEEEKEETPAAPSLRKYEIKVPKPDGEEGFYRTIPEVKLTHVSACGTTCYRLKASGKKNISGELKTKGQSVTLGKDHLGEGKNTLTVWMEDEHGKKVKDLTSRYVFSVDTMPPQVELTVPGSFDDWYPGQVTITARAKDDTSKAAFLTLYVSGKQKEKAAGGRAGFTITQASTGGNGCEVTVTAQDRAGNQTSVSRTVYIDASPPKIEIAGAKDFLITGRPVSLTYKVKEENALEDVRAWAEYESVEGKKKVLRISDFKDGKEKKTATQKFTKDGIYRVHVEAKDLAGQTCEKELQVILDQVSPVIRHVEEIKNAQMPSFRWNYTRNEMIRDFTTFTYEIRLDGQFYHRGTCIRTEGHHLLEVSARDAAGNTARAAADFVVDHTAPVICFDQIEDGAAYDQTRTFSVFTEDEADEISEIRMNGDTKELLPEEGAYRYTVDEPGKYTVEVKARDAAGNTSKECISFEILPEETWTQKIQEPIRRLFTGDEEQESEPEGEKPTGGKISILWVAVGLLILLGFLAAGILVFRKKKKK